MLRDHGVKMVPLMFLIAAAAQTQVGSPFVKPAWAQFAVPWAVDHVAVMSVKRGWGPPGEDRATVTQSGGWLREDVIERGKSSTSISNLQSAMSYHYTRQPDGQYGSLAISGKHGAALRVVEKTDDTDRLLGENCTIWLFKADGLTEKNCLTTDGIMLWQSIIGHSGTELSSARALSVKRMPIQSEEVEVPRDLLSLASWNGWSVKRPTGLNDEVLLESAPTSLRKENLLIRRLGASVMTDSTSGRGRSRTFSGQGVRLAISEMPDGSLNRLDLTRVRPAAIPSGPAGKPAPLSPPKTLTILGEQCSMFDMAPGVSDFGQTQCQTQNGLVLEQNTVSWGSRSAMVAVAVTKGKLRPADVSPPANILLAIDGK
jgi:hypothetical protein